MERLAKGLPVHPGHHQDLAGIVLLSDGGNQAVVVEGDRVERGFEAIHIFRLLGRR